MSIRIETKRNNIIFFIKVLLLLNLFVRISNKEKRDINIDKIYIIIHYIN